jgi:alpha-L-rhamnosidase
MHPLITKPVFENHYNGFGISHCRPRISWRFLSAEGSDPVSGWIQTAYDIEITSRHHDINPQVYHVESEQSTLVPWPGPTLASRDNVNVRVRSYGKNSENYCTRDDFIPSQWSESGTAEVSLLNHSDWKASFITSSTRIGPAFPLQPLRFRKEFILPDGYTFPVSGRLYITSLGVFEVYINGKLASNECMAPGWTSYNHRLNYRVLDVSSFLLPNETNVIAAEVAEGWYATVLGFRGGRRFNYGGTEISLFAQLEIRRTEDCDPWILATDDSWSCSPSAIQSSELYNGEILDLRREFIGWNQPLAHQDSTHWISTKIISQTPAKLVASDAPPVSIVEVRRPSKIFQDTKGKTILDFGQNLVGKLLVKCVDLPRDGQLIFSHAEVMECGELGTRPLNLARATDTIIASKSGSRLENWSPKFTFHGFRYAQVDGWPVTPGNTGPGTDDIVALIMHSDMKRRGYFECSNQFVNKLHENIVWSMRGNFLSIPTDCPQRDERLGWTADIQVFCPTASFIYNTTSLLADWLENLAAEQLEEDRGGIPGLVCPDIPLKDWPRIPQALWHDVTILTPYVLYQYSHDETILERQFESMQAWLDQGIDRGPDGLWNPERWQLGDWLDPTAPPDQPAYSRTDGTLVADAYLVHVTFVFSTVCTVLGKVDLAAKYVKDATKLKLLFQRKYISPAGNLMSSSQTGISLAIKFSLYENIDQLVTAAGNLSKLVRAAKFRIATGFAGTPVISYALTTIGQSQLAYRMLLEKGCPSWMYPITMGATTCWERWDSMLPDGTINPGRMTSFNHYALGSVADWLHSTVGGISPLSGGWKTFNVRPVPGGNLTSAKVRFDGPYGLIECSWSWDQKSGSFELNLLVPYNSNALVTLPSELRQFTMEVEEKKIVVGSGRHEFQCKYLAPEWPPPPILSPNITWNPENENIAA